MKTAAKIIGSLIALLIIGGAIFWRVIYLHEAEDVIIAPKQTQNIDKELEKTEKAEEQPMPDIINYDVAFVAQAPLANWDDERQQDGCEEASALMAMSWVRGEALIKKEAALKEILALSDYEQKVYKEYRDINVHDVVKWIFNDYFKYEKVKVVENIKLEQIIDELYKGNIILAPANGQLLYNPYFTQPGPERHMLVIKGYNKKTKQFITNDPGTKRGENYRYDESILFNAILAYPTGYHVSISTTPKDVIVVSK